MALSHVDSEGFQTLIARLAGPNLVVHGRTFYTKKVEKMYTERMALLISTLGKVDFVSTTADLWSSRNRKKYLGETVHWLNREMKRINGCLAIKRMIGAATYYDLGRLIEENHNRYGVEDKVVMMTTDNGSNFLKAAREFSDYSGAPQFDEENCDEDFDEIEFLDLSAILQELPEPSSLPPGTLPVCLPPHSKCACHLSNLCCTADVAKITDSSFKRLLRSVEGKITALCNAQSLSDNTSDLFRGNLHGLFVKKNDTRWNSSYNSKFRVKHFLNTMKPALIDLMAKLNIPQFQPVETLFLDEYLKVMKLVVDFLDIMQGEQTIGMGYLLPSLYILEKALKSFDEDTTIKYCRPLVKSLMNSYATR